SIRTTSVDGLSRGRRWPLRPLAKNGGRRNSRPPGNATGRRFFDRVKKRVGGEGARRDQPVDLYRFFEFACSYQCHPSLDRRGDAGAVVVPSEQAGLQHSNGAASISTSQQTASESGSDGDRETFGVTRDIGTAQVAKAPKT